MLAILAGSASCIAAPAAMRTAVPEADPSLPITAALAVTFPFNILLGIPMYPAAGSGSTAEEARRGVAHGRAAFAVPPGRWAGTSASK